MLWCHVSCLKVTSTSLFYQALTNVFSQGLISFIANFVTRTYPQF